MKLERLHLKAYGVFQDRVIDLPRRGHHDMHLVYGPNEAGKSTLLRAVTAFLFDIPERTEDAFRHDYTALRVGATVVLSDGSRMSAMRRKARKTKLFALDEATGQEITDQPLPENALADLLQGLDLTHYRHLFALDITGLEEGSEELLRGEGEVGRSLFQAAAGVASLRGVLDTLDEEAGQIFKPRGSTTRLNRVLGELDDKKRTLRQSTVRTTAWETVRRDLEQAEQRYGRLRARLREIRTQQSQLQRIAGNLPLLAERLAKSDELTELAHIPELAPEAPQTRATAQERLRQANEAWQSAEGRRKTLVAALAGVAVRTALLERAAAVEQAFHTVRAFRESRDALPRLLRERQGHEENVVGLLREVGAAVEVATASALLPDETISAKLQSLIDDHVRLDADSRQLQERLDIAVAAHETATSSLAALPAPRAVDALATAVAEHAGLGDLEDRIRALDLQITEEAGKLEANVAGIWSGTPSEWLALKLPQSETVADFEREFFDLGEEERSAEQEFKTLRHDLRDRKQELEVFAATGEAITQTDVAGARTARDQTWKELRRLHVDGDSPRSTTASLAQFDLELTTTFEEALREADRLADLLRADTARATNLETTRGRIRAMQEALHDLELARTERAAKVVLLQQRWLALLAPYQLHDIKPAAFRAWMAQHERLVAEHIRLEGLRLEREQVQARITKGRAQLDAAMLECALSASTAEESGKGLVLRAQAACSAAAREDSERRLASEILDRANEECTAARRLLGQADEQLREWRGKWITTTQSLRLPADAVPAQARIRLDQFARISASLAEIRRIDWELADHQRTVDDFGRMVLALADYAGEAVQGCSPDELASRLYEALSDERAQEQRQRQLQGDIDHESRTLAEARLQEGLARQTLQGLVASAGCATEDELPAFETRSARKQALLARLREIDEQLVQINARPVEHVVQEAGDLTLDAVARDRADRDAEVEGLDKDLEEAQEALLGARRQFETIDGAGVAADAQQEALSLAARAVKEARTYARLKLASTLLTRVIQAYREQHQGPMLRRASAVFSRITLGSFSGLVVDYEDDQQVLLGMRPSGERIAVAGMSQGTRDQLFLSLRIAAIEQHIESRGPLPVIVDDLLVQFDDARAMATLEVLGEISTRTQVLFFTHHGHLVDLVEASPLGLTISVQRL